ncbi:MAG: cellulase family glycosylhydrolase [Bryobacteraceae bacterium]
MSNENSRSMDLRVLFPAVAVLTCLAHAEVVRNAYAIATFDNTESLGAWSVSGSGSLNLGHGYRASGAVLTFRIEPGARVIVAWSPKTAIPKLQNSDISLWARFPGSVAVTLKAEDTGGNTLMLPIEASLEHPKQGEWRHAVGQIKKQITSLALIIQSRTGSAISGELYFDEVMLSKNKNVFRVSPEERTDAPSAGAKSLGIMGVNIHLLKDPHSLDLARDAGFQFVRMDLLWTNVERRGRFRFFAYDFLLRDLEARGMSALWILDYGHPEHGGSVPRSAADIAAFSRFAEAVATHYRGRNVRYEIWNEPNNPQFWASSPNPTEYAALLREAVTAMRRADPAAIISSGGISNMDLSYASRALDRSLAAMLNAISVHPYPRDRPESIAPAYAAFRYWIGGDFGDSTELWNSEWGYSSTLAAPDSAQKGHGKLDRYRQANLAVREILTVWSLGFPLSVWYDLRDDGDDPGNPEQNYGLLDSGGREKPAIQAVRNLMNSTRARKFTGMVPEPPSSVHGMRFAGANDVLLIVWTDSPEKKERVECDRTHLISATDMMGRMLQTKSGPEGYLHLKFGEDAGPVYLLFKTGSRP